MTKLKIAAGLAVVALAVGLAPAAVAAPVELTLPAPTGPYPVGTTELHLVDHDRPDPWAEGRSRELMVSLWYPAVPHGRRAQHLPPAIADYYEDLAARDLGIEPGTADFAGTTTHSRVDAIPLPGRRPVVLYSPGGGNSRFFGTTLVEDLASRGYVVVGIDHTPASPVQFPDRFELPGSGVDMAQVLREQVRDTSFVLDELERFPMLDLTRVGMFGHSIGGFTAAEAMVTEPRIAAGVNMDGSMGAAYGQAATVGVMRPFLLMGGGLTSGKPHNHANSPDWRSFWDASTGWQRDLYLPAAEHGSFSDAQSLLPQVEGDFTAAIGTVDPRRSLAAQRKYLAAFFDLHLRNRPTTVFDRPSDPDVEIVP